jgi:hypothetical protein
MKATVMSALSIILTVPLLLEFVFAPFNLWTGRTMDNFVRFTGWSPRVATTLFAPVKLATAVVLAVGLFLRGPSIAGAALSLAISLVYLVRLAHPRRRDGAGLAGFTLFGALAAALLVVDLVA